MKVLVTGEDGQLARALTERAGAWDGISLVCIGRPELDLEVPGSIQSVVQIHKPDVIVNAARLYRSRPGRG